MIDIKREKNVPLPAPGVPEDVDLEIGNVNYDYLTRKPSRRVSAVDPVKLRIVDATLKQVQDKTFSGCLPFVNHK